MRENEILLDKGNNFITCYGTTIHTLKPSVIYLRTKSKITPIVNKKDYENEVTVVKLKFTDFVDKYIHQSKTMDDDYLFNIDISPKSVKFGKTSFLRYDVYLKPYNPKPLVDYIKKVKQMSLQMDKKLEELLNQNNIITKFYK